MKKKQRHKVYKAMLEAMKDDRDYIRNGILYVGFCHFLFKTVVNQGGSSDLEDYPELIKHKPKKMWSKNPGGYWWNPCSIEGTNKRIKVVKKAIKDTK